MRKTTIAAVLAALIGLLAAPASAGTVHQGTRTQGAHTQGKPGPATVDGLRTACAATAPGKARCFAEFRTAAAYRARTGTVAPAVVQPAGYGPFDLADAYGLPIREHVDQTIAIVDAYDDPYAEDDLAAYRAAFGLPRCTTANGCFRKVNQRGAQGDPPQADEGWAVEISLDVQMASASCSRCHILLVESDDSALENMAAAVDTAVALGATVVSNSYGAGEVDGITAFAAHYRHAGVPIVASSGDSGYDVANFPAALGTVIAVGGTTLARADEDRGWVESAWRGAGSSCSDQFDKPSWQHDRQCPGRTVADVSAVADPDSGVAVYDTYLEDQYGPGWQVIGGTSAAAPIIAGAYALAANGRDHDTPAGLYHGAAADHLYDVVGGSNGFCRDDYLCTGLPGYDAPTGVGTPNGLGAF
jgi:subtilase family serine protease